MAQAPVKIQQATRLSGAIAYVTVSGMQLHVKQLNNALTANNYGKVNEYGFSFGGGCSYVIRKIVIGAGGAWISNSGTKGPSANLNLQGGYGYGTIGYVVHASKRSLFYPTLGLGSGGYTIRITEKNLQTDFSQQLQAPKGTVKLEAEGFMATLQFNWFYFINSSNLKGYGVGLQAGYNFSPNSWNMRMHTAKLSHSPELNMNGFFVTIMLGGGGIIQH